MTREEAMELAEQWEALEEEADAKWGNGCPAEVDRLLAEADAIDARLREAGYEAFTLLCEQARKRAMGSDNARGAA